MALGAEFFAEEADELAAPGGGDGAPLEEGGVGLGDGFGRVGRVDGGELRDDFAGDGGANGEVAVGLSEYAEFGEDGFDFVWDRHDWLVASVEVGACLVCG